ncbi:MAG: hypothetical protein H6883_00430 [Rhodobiaceae bacterium]|nr:hypothetical protein [Rhodobiaceae bacterium]
MSIGLPLHGGIDAVLIESALLSTRSKEDDLLFAGRSLWQALPLVVDVRNGAVPWYPILACDRRHDVRHS